MSQWSKYKLVYPYRVTAHISADGQVSLTKRVGNKTSKVDLTQSEVKALLKSIKEQERTKAINKVKKVM